MHDWALGVGPELGALPWLRLGDGDATDALRTRVQGAGAGGGVDASDGKPCDLDPLWRRDLRKMLRPLSRPPPRPRPALSPRTLPWFGPSFRVPSPALPMAQIP